MLMGKRCADERLSFASGNPKSLPYSDIVERTPVKTTIWLLLKAIVKGWLKIRARSNSLGVFPPVGRYS